MEQDWAIQSIQVKKTIPLEEAQEIFKKVIKKKPRKVREKGDWYRFRVIPPTKFQPKSFRTKVVNDNIHIVLGVIKEENKRMVGGGMWDYFKKAYDYVATKASDAFDYVKKAVSITDYSDTTKKYLQQYGHLPILAIQLRRAPLNVAIDLALQGVSTGKWMELKKKYGFDEFYHLSMLVTLGGAVEQKKQNGRVVKYPKKLAIEKLAVVSINENVAIESDMETLSISSSQTTIQNMFDKAREKYGDTRFFTYSALGNNNCQNFIRMLLEVEGLYSEEAKQFVFQDISELVKELPESTKTISQGLTDIGALANKYLGIGGRKNKKSGYNKEMVKKGGSRSNVVEGIEMDMTPNGDLRVHIEGGIVPLDFVLDEKDSYEKLQGQLAGIGISDNEARRVWKETRDMFKGIKGIQSKVPTDVFKEIGSFTRGSGKKVSLDDLLEKEGGNKASGFIRAMMARDNASEDEKQEYGVEKNRKKFKNLDRKGFRVQELTKTTHDLLDTKKSLTRNQAIKRFYDYIKANAPQHEPHRAGKTNYVGAYDLDDMYDRWVQTEGVEVREGRRGKVQENVRNEELVAPLFEEAPRPRVISRPVVRRPVIEEEIPDPPSADSVFRFVRDNSVAELKRRLRGKTAQELIAFYRRGGGAIREKLRDVATAVGATHRRPPDAKGPGAITTEGVAQNIVEKVR